MSDKLWREVRVVVFDVGETLIDETRQWGEWADWLGVPRFTFFAALGGVIARGGHHRGVFELFRPGFDIAAARRQRISEGWRDLFAPADLYPDALPAVRALRDRGFKIGIAGNQPAEATKSLTTCGLDADFIITSEELGFQKPDPRFFQAILTLAGESDPRRIAYVGDRIDNDVIPAMQAGMVSVFIRRGPWSVLQRSNQQGTADAEITSLLELPALFGR